MTITRTKSELSSLLICPAFKQFLCEIIESHTKPLIDEISKLNSKIEVLTDTNRDLIKLYEGFNNVLMHNNITDDNAVIYDSSAEPFFSDDTIISNKNSQSSKNEILSISVKKQNTSVNSEPKILNHNISENNNFRVANNRRSYRNKHNNGQTAKNKAINSKNNKRYIVGNGNSSDGFEGSDDRKIWLYVGKCKPSTTKTSIATFLEKKHPNSKFDVVDLNSKGNSKSFRVSTDNVELFDDLYNPNNWPKHTIIKQFTFFRRSKFSNSESASFD